MSEDFINKVKSIFEGKAPPFLFIGSGFSRRHIGLPDFNGLLEMTCLDNMKDYAYYKIKSSSNPPEAAKYISNDFYDAAWENKKCADFLHKITDKCKDISDVYKFYVAECIQNMHTAAKDAGYALANEIDTLKEATIDGIITTNYDVFLEEIFPKFRTYIGQSELIQGNPQFIGEIYKIHGSVTDPSTIIITNNDYNNFNENNKYLAAKLLSLFIEKPIIFIGYSINDKHIQHIIADMCSCCSDNIKRIQGNLIFLNRMHSSKEICTESLLTIGKTSIPYWNIETNDFSKIYSQIKEKRQVPAHLFRFFREQLYEIAKTGTPVERIKIKDINEIDSGSEIDFFVGIGINKKDKSYEAYDRLDVIKDILFDTGNFNNKELIEKIITYSLKTGTKFIPIYKYLKGMGIDSKEKCLNSEIPNEIKTVIMYETTQYAASSDSQYGRFYNKIRNKTISGVIDATKTKKGYTQNILPMVPASTAKKELEILKSHLIKNFEEKKLPTAFIKSVCYYDRLKYGWD